MFIYLILIQSKQNHKHWNTAVHSSPKEGKVAFRKCLLVPNWLPHTICEVQMWSKKNINLAWGSQGNFIGLFNTISFNYCEFLEGSWNSTIFDNVLSILEKIILTLRIGGNWDSSHCSSNCMFFWRFDEFFACVLSNLKYFGIWQIAMTLSLYHE